MTIARERLLAAGTYLMAPAELNACLGVGAAAWQRFGCHWNELAPDPYAAKLGTRRLRRYGHFMYRTDDHSAVLMPRDAFVQADGSNPLYVDLERHFEPLTDRFTHDPMLHGVLEVLGDLATALDDVNEWHAKATPFRVFASPDACSSPTPEGLHRDGVTLVSSLLIDRHNVVGGESSVHGADGGQLMETTLREPGTLLVGDDRSTLHGVSPIRPRDPAAAAWRDVLVITFAPSTP